MAAFTKNPFALLGDDNDGDAPAAPAKASKPAAGTPIPQATQRVVPGQQQARRPKSDYPSRGGPRNVFRGERPEGSPAGGDEGFSSVNAKDDRAERTRGGSRGTGRGQGRGGRGGPGRGGRGPRPDRHSQTGIHDSEKKEHQGWGGDEGKRELEAEVEGERDAVGEAKVDGSAPAGAWDDKDATAAGPNWGASEGKEGKANGVPAPVVEEEEEDNTLTYEEYLAQQAAGSTIGGIESRAARAANVGADDSQWKNAVEVIRKGQEDEAYIAASKTKKLRERAEKSGKQYIEIEPHFAPPERRGGGERGGRGRGSPRGGDRGDRRGAPRGAGRGRDGPNNRGSRASPRGPVELNPDDTTAFPSLS